MNAVIFDLGSVVFEWEPRRFVARALEINRIFDDVDDEWCACIAFGIEAAQHEEIHGEADEPNCHARQRARRRLDGE